MRAELTDVGFCLMVATMLHSVATGNILPASIPLVCVDINPATVTKLADRGSSQARGIVTDVGLFLEQLAHRAGAGVPARLTSPTAAGQRRARSAAPTTPASGPELAPAPAAGRRGARRRPASACQRRPGRLEQQVAGGRDAAPDHDDARGRRPRPGWPRRRPASRRPRRTPPRATQVAVLGGRGDHRAGQPVGSPSHSSSSTLGSRPSRSRAKRTRALPLEYCSQQPRPPHSHGRPSGTTCMCPNSPAMPLRAAVHPAVEHDRAPDAGARA